MAPALVLDPACDAVHTLLHTDATIIGTVGGRIYPDPANQTNPDVPQRPTYPYLSVEAAGEVPFNTMGARTGAKWGGTARIRVRFVSQFRGDREVREGSSQVRAALDGQRVTLAGFGTALLTFEGLTPLESAVGNVLTREWVSEYAVTAHQAA